MATTSESPSDSPQSSSGPVVFISYSHEPPENMTSVLDLSEKLRSEGIATILDQYVNGSPEEGWPRWMMNQLDISKFALVVCTETYYRRFRGKDVPGKGKGVDWEGLMITQKLYDARSSTTRFVPVLLSADAEQFIPEPLRHCSYYDVFQEEGYRALYDFLLGQAGVEPGPLGELKIKSGDSRKPIPNLITTNSSERDQHTSAQPVREFSDYFAEGVLPAILRSETARRFVGRQEYKDQLTQAWEERATSVVVVYGLAGQGKTTLVSNWIVEHIIDLGRPIFAYSFLNQGTDAQNWSDHFLREALRAFDLGRAGTEIDQIDSLVACMSSSGCVVVLDGLEVLQSAIGDPTAEGSMNGRFHDPIMGRFVSKVLALEDKSVFCLVSSRLRLGDSGTACHRALRQIELPRMAPAEAVALLAPLGGDRGERPKVMEKLAQQCGYHALSMTLVMNYLCATEGSVRSRWRHIDEAVRVSSYDEVIRKVVDYYYKLLLDREDRHLLVTLAIACAMERPLPLRWLLGMRRQFDDPWLDPIRDCSDEALGKAINALASLGFGQARRVRHGDLVFDPHPVVRNSVQDFLKSEASWLGGGEWRIVNRTLSRYYAMEAKGEEHDPEAMELLLRSVDHACEAGDPAWSYTAVYKQRIMKKGDLWAIKKHGMVEAVQRAIARLRVSEEHVVQSTGLVVDCAKFEEEDRIDLLIQEGFCFAASEGYASLRAANAFAEACGRQERLESAERAASEDSVARGFNGRWGMWVGHLVSGRLEMAKEAGTKLLELSQAMPMQPHFLVEANRLLGTTQFFRGEFIGPQGAEFFLTRAIEHAEKLGDELTIESAWLFLAEPHVNAMCYLAMVRQLVGKSTSARALAESAIARAARLGDPFTICIAHIYGSWIFGLQGDWSNAHHHAMEGAESAKCNGFSHWGAGARIFLEWIRCSDDSIPGHGTQDCAERMRSGIKAWRDREAKLLLTFYYTLMAQVLLKQSRWQEAEEALAESNKYMTSNQEHFYEAEILRCGGVLAMRQRKATEGQRLFEKAQMVARNQGSMALEWATLHQITREWPEHDSPFHDLNVRQRMRHLKKAMDKPS